MLFYNMMLICYMNRWWWYVCDCKPNQNVLQFMVKVNPWWFIWGYDWL